MEDFDQELENEYKRLMDHEAGADEAIAQIERKINRFTFWGWTFVSLGFVCFFAGFYIYFFDETSMENLNLLGDFFGGSVASLWSLAALLFIFVAFLGQKQQLINQQKEVRYNQYELKATRVEILRQRQQMEGQTETLRRQRFENTFFQLMTMHSDIVNDLDIVSESMERETGSDCFHVIFYEFRKFIHETLKPEEWKIPEKVDGAWIEFYRKYDSEIGHYIRNLYHILKFVQKSELGDKLQYSKFVRSRLSSDELLVLLYNCHSSLGRDKFKPLLEEFNMLKNLPAEDLIDPVHRQWYAPGAFGGDC